MEIKGDLIAGTPIDFGTSKEKRVDNNGSTFFIQRNQGHIVGSGIFVANLTPTSKDGLRYPGIGGACSFCKEEAVALFQANLIDTEEAYRRSLFDTDSAAQCAICGRRDLCIRHCRPFEIDEGSVAPLCPECTKTAQREKRFKKIITFLASPLTEQKKLPPPKQEGDHND